MSRRVAGELHRIDYTRWSEGVQVDPKRRVVQCPSCKKPGAREVKAVYDYPHGRRARVRVARRFMHLGPVVHVEALVEWLNPETKKYEVRPRPVKSCEAAELETT